MKIKTLDQLEAFLETRIPTRETLFMGDLGLKRAKYLMKLLGNPQNKIRVIHVAGTSGKGSTTHLVSHLLQSQGFKVGMSISPHVFDIRERMQINNQLPSEKLVLKYFNQILPIILKMEKCPYGMPTFFEINVALAFYMFAKEKLDYAIMETGLGGLLDATNTVTAKNKICIITKLGLDHTEILGKTISKIAQQKAGIINNKNIVINIEQTKAAQNILNKKCQLENSHLFTIKQPKNFSIISSSPQETVFNFSFNITPGKENSLFHSKTIVQKWCSFEKIKLGLIGIHQAENCSLALSCITVLSQRDKFKINETTLRDVLKKIRIPGRLEICKFGKQTLIIDGAHNPQKMNATTSNLAKIYPKQKFTFIVAFKKGKDYQEMLKLIVPMADKILLTQFSTSGMDNHWSSIDNTEISTFLISQKFKNFSTIKNNKTEILKVIRGIPACQQAGKKPVIITGSLYLIGSIYPFFKK